MSQERRIGRSALFDAFRGKSAPPVVSPSPSFDLRQFYRTRASDGQSNELPEITLRPGLPLVATLPPFGEPFPLPRDSRGES
jgi:hypothetical protein